MRSMQRLSKSGAVIPLNKERPNLCWSNTSVDDSKGDLIMIDLTADEIEVLDDYIFRKLCKLKDAGLEDARCYKHLSSVHHKLKHSNDAIKVGDIFFTQGLINGCPYPLLFKVVQVCKDHYRAESMANKWQTIKISKATLVELGASYCRSPRQFVAIDSCKLTDELIWLVTKEWNFALIASKTNDSINAANNLIRDLKQLVDKLSTIPTMDIDRWQ